MKTKRLDDMSICRGLSWTIMKTNVGKFLIG